MSKQMFRFLRVLEYVGTHEQVADALERRSVKGSAPKEWNGGGVLGLRIYEAVLGDVPQPIEFRFARDIIKALMKKKELEGNLLPEHRHAFQDILEELPL